MVAQPPSKEDYYAMLKKHEIVRGGKAILDSRASHLDDDDDEPSTSSSSGPSDDSLRHTRSQHSCRRTNPTRDKYSHTAVCFGLSGRACGVLSAQCDNSA